LIGADGVHSRVRSLLFGARDAAFSGRNAWRAMALLDTADDHDVHLWLGPRAHLVHYRCGPEGPTNAVAVTSGEPASPGWGTPGSTSALMCSFDEWAAAPRRFMERFAEWMAWPLMTGPPLTGWAKGAATLLGDAAHPIMPFLASGAVMAFEDAATLAAEMDRSRADAPAAFARYEARRMPRTHRVSQGAARMGEIYHMSGVMRLARNLSLAALPGQRLLSRNDWLYAHNAGDQDGG
jgi:salicylate hydroxylase